MQKKSKRKTILIIYFIVVAIALITILFILPDSFFQKNYEEFNNFSQPIKKEFVDYSIQQAHLLKRKYEYEYKLLDSMGSQTYTYECKGTLDEEIESGTCKLPEKMSYNEKNKDEIYKNINTNYLDVEYIFNLIEDVEPQITKYQTFREYNYNIKIKELSTEIVIHTDLNEITKIYISNAYMTYILKYTNVSY